MDELQPPPMHRQSGIVLLEALLAILVFSLGILALIGLQATAVKQSTDARYRSEAALLANDIVSQMWASDRSVATLQANFNTGGATYNTWLSRVTAALPGVIANTATAPTVNVDGQGVATVTLYWKAPNEESGATPHNFVTIAQIR